jgi:membrane protease YdiL (CAAX protease family)
MLEELLFRGILQRVVERVLGYRWSILYVSVLFGVLHIGHRSALDVVLVSAIGVGFAIARQRTQSLLGPVLAHGIANTMLFVVVPLWRP